MNNDQLDTELRKVGYWLEWAKDRNCWIVDSLHDSYYTCSDVIEVESLLRALIESGNYTNSRITFFDGQWHCFADEDLPF